VLVADDSESARRALSILLTSHPGIDIVAEAVDGAEAVRKAKKYRPDVVLLDITMPTMNGFVAARLIMDAVPSARVLMVSQHHSPAFVKEAIHAGAIGYLVKSDAGRDLVRQLASIQDAMSAA